MLEFYHTLIKLFIVDPWRITQHKEDFKKQKYFINFSLDDLL